MSLQYVLDQLNTNYTSITDLIPTKVNFDDYPYDYSSILFNPYVFSVLAETNGKVVVGGNLLLRFNADGSLDELFSQGFNAAYTGDARIVAQQSSGKYIIAGPIINSLGYPQCITRLNTDGSIDTSFNAGSGFTISNVPYVCQVLPDDSILFAGHLFTFNGVSCKNLVKLNADGSLNSTFASNLPNLSTILALDVDANGNIFAGGYYNYLIKLLPDGTQDTSFNPTINGDVFSIKVDSNGKVLVGGFLNTYNGSDVSSLIRIESNGDLDIIFPTTGAGLRQKRYIDSSLNTYNNTVFALAIQSDGTIIVGGRSTNYNSGTAEEPVWSLAKNIFAFNSDGSVNTTFSTGFGFDGTNVFGLTVDSNDNVFCAGDFSRYNRQNCTSEYNCSGTDLWAGCCVKLSPTGALIGTPYKQNINPIGIYDDYLVHQGGYVFNTNINQAYPPSDVAQSIPFTHSVLNPYNDTYANTLLDAAYTIAYDYGFQFFNYDFMIFDAAITPSDEYFGVGSSYFTQMYPGLLVLAANDIKINEFNITGDFYESVDTFESGSIELNVNGKIYSVFYKSTTGSLSTATMIMVDGSKSGITLDIYDPLDTDAMVLTGLSGRNELYVLVFYRFDNQHTSQSLFEQIARGFLSQTSPETFATSLTPAIRNLASDGSLDTAIDANGHSIQRTLNDVFIPNGSNYKVAGRLKDGDIFSKKIEKLEDLPFLKKV